MTGYIGLGSNVGDRLAHLRAARDGLGRAGAEVTACSGVYETAPVGEVSRQRDFLNACVAVETDLPAEELLDRCKALEREIGRRPEGPRHGPRPIDLDLLLLDDLECRGERLTLPHRDLLTRRFVLLPLLELDPQLALPDGTRLVDALESVVDQRAERVADL